MNSNKTICFQAIQETYRNSVISYVRTRMKTAYPEDWQNRLRQLFRNSSEWAEIKRKMKEREVSHVVDIVTEDDFDMLSVNHFCNLFDLEFNVLCPVTVVAGTDGREGPVRFRELVETSALVQHRFKELRWRLQSRRAGNCAL